MPERHESEHVLLGVEAVLPPFLEQKLGQGQRLSIARRHSLVSVGGSAEEVPDVGVGRDVVGDGINTRSRS